MPNRLRRRAGLLTLLIASAATATHGGAWSKPQRRPAAEPVTTLHQAVADAWARLPQRDTFAAQQNVADARYVAGGARVPNAPTASGTYVDDRAGNNYNYITTQIGISTPVWLPGEGTATQNAARAESASIEAQTGMAHLALASRVLELATYATDALNARAVAARRRATNQALAADLAHRFGVGESAQSDALAADAEAASAAVSLAQAEAQLGAARVALATVTGSQAVPLLVAPAGPVLAGASRQHPQLLAAAQQLEAAHAQERLVYIQDRDDPEIGLEGINEKQPGTRWDTRFGVTVKFHFATQARNAPRRAAAAEAVTKAAVRLELARRAVAAAVAQAHVALEAAERAAAAAERGAAALDKRRGQIERAWRLGEMPFIELVRANALAFEAEAEAARDKARTGRAGAGLQLRLARGVLP